MPTTRVSLTLEDDVLRRVREISRGNVSRYVNGALAERLEADRRRRLREDLVAAYREKADEDIEICQEWRFADAETAAMEDE